MSFEVDIAVRVHVNNQAEAEKIMEAAFSGLAADVLRVGILHGMFSGFGGGVNSPTEDLLSGEKKKAKAVESAVELKRKEFDTATTTVAAEEKKPVAPKPKGLAGRKRMERVGRK